MNYRYNHIIIGREEVKVMLKSRTFQFLKNMVRSSSLNFKDNRPTLLNQTLSGKKQVRQIGSQYFSFTVQMPPVDQLKAQEIFAFLSKDITAEDT